MAWARVDDAWWCHPKVLALDLDARGLWVSVLSWSCQQKTDRIPEQIVRMCGDDGTAAAKLVAAGLWDEQDAGWSVHDWHDYQSESARKADAGRKGGKASGESRRAAAEAKQDDEADEGASREAEKGASDEAGPSRPVPTQPSPTPKPKNESRASRLPDGWRPDPEPELVKAVGGQKAAAEQFDRFCDHWRAQPGAKGRKVDWQATWRNWLRRAPEFSGGGARAPADTGSRREPEVGSDEFEARRAAQKAREDAVLGA